MAPERYKAMKSVNRFLHDWRVDAKVLKLQPHVELGCRIEYRITATWDKSDELINLAIMAAEEAADYINIRVSYNSIYTNPGRLDFDVSGHVLKELGF